MQIFLDPPATSINSKYVRLLLEWSRCNFGVADQMKIKRSTLKEVNPENVRRLAKFLKLNITGMSDNQVVGLVSWRLSPRRAWRSGTGYF